MSRENRWPPRRPEDAVSDESLAEDLARETGIETMLRRVPHARPAIDPETDGVLRRLLRP